MNFNVPHMIVTALLIFGVLMVLERFEGYRTASKGKKFALMVVPLFVVLLVFNLLWPYHP